MTHLTLEYYNSPGTVFFVRYMEVSLVQSVLLCASVIIVRCMTRCLFALY